VSGCQFEPTDLIEVSVASQKVSSDHLAALIHLSTCHISDLDLKISVHQRQHLCDHLISSKQSAELQ